MAYCNASHVNAFCPKRVFSATSYPASGGVQQFIDQTAGVIDGLLAARDYQLPIPTTATAAWKVLERANSLGAWAQVEESALTSEDVDRAVKAWDQVYRQLENGEIKLPDVAKVTGEGRARAGGVATPWFSRDMDL